MFTAIKRASKLLLRPSFSYKAVPSNIQSMNKIDVVNNNMKFIANKTDLYVIPYHPTLYIKGNKSIQVDTDCTVVEFCFVERSQIPNDLDQKWREKISLNFNFSQLGNLLSIMPGNNSAFQISFANIKENFKIEDNIQNKMMMITYNKEEESNSSIKKSISFKEQISYEQFCLIQAILKEAVYDLSGLRLVFDFKKREAIQQLRSSITGLKTKELQINSYYQA